MNEAMTSNASGLPGRLDVRQTAKELGFGEHDIPILVGAHLLKPLGNPVACAPKYFARCEVLRLANDIDFLHRATQAVSRNWRKKNAKRSLNALIRAA